MANEPTREEQQHPYSFNPNEHIIQIKSSQGMQDYLPVQWRLVWFNEQCPKGKITILEQVIDLDREITKDVYVWNPEKRKSEKVPKTAKGYAWFKVRVEDGNGKVGEAFGSECAVDFDEFAEKADTKATGRALAKIGYGTQFAAEFDEGQRLVDSPVEHKPAAATTTTGAASGTTKQPIVAIRSNPVADEKKPEAEKNTQGEPLITDQQIASIRKMSEHLGVKVPDTIATTTFANAKIMIENLSKKYRESRKPEPPSEPEPEPEKDLIRTPITEGTLTLAMAYIEDQFGPHEYLTFVQMLGLDPDPTKWTEDEGKTFDEYTLKWFTDEPIGDQGAIRTVLLQQDKTKAQAAEFNEGLTFFGSKTAIPAVKELCKRLGIPSEGLNYGQTDQVLKIFRQAKLYHALKAELKIQNEFFSKGMTSVLDLYGREALRELREFETKILNRARSAKLSPAFQKYGEQLQAAIQYLDTQTQLSA